MQVLKVSYMKKTIKLITIIGIVFIITGCIYKNKNIKKSEGDNIEMISSINVIIDNKKYTVNIESNETAQTFVSKLPQSFEMSELNGNEKYVYMNNTFPTNPSNPKKIVAGDIMLYGNDCLVIFYKSFETSYSYTKIGHIDNLGDLGNDNIIVKFEKSN